MDPLDQSSAPAASNNSVPSKTLDSAGPVSGVSSVITGAAKSISTGVGNIFSAIEKSISNMSRKLPMPNVLSSYATYNYVISLTCLDANSFNNPDSTYMTGKLPPLILNSANALPNNRITTSAGKLDFYINDLTLSGQFGFNVRTGNTNTFSLEFSVIEPYSMGLFMVACQQAAYERGYMNFNDASYLLVIEFRGNDQVGNIKNIPDTKKYIPFRFNDINMKVTSAGSVYTIQGYGTSGQALNDSVKIIKKDISISGKTVQEILQTGPNSLQKAINDAFAQLKKDNKVKIADEIIILFPNSRASAASGAAANSSTAPENKTPASASPSAQLEDKQLFQKLGVTRSTVNSTLIQKEEDCNPIGKANLGFDETRKANRTFPKDQNVYDQKNQTYIQSMNTSKAGDVSFIFNQKASITSIINEVLINSKYAEAALDQKDDKGRRPWWRIDTQTYHIPSKDNQKTTGEVPKIYVYRVIPYGVDANKFQAPGSKPAGIAKAKLEAAKEFNYIFTGKNTEVIKFDFTLNNAFYQTMAADNFKKSGDTKTAGQLSGDQDTKKVEENKAPSEVPTSTNDYGPETYTANRTGTADASLSKDSTQSSGSAGSPGVMAATKSTETKTRTDGNAGAASETPATRSARIFHDALTLGVDMMTLEMEIMGDPYFISNSGIGNYSSKESKNTNVDDPGNVDYQSSEVDVIVNFRTPIDIIQGTGLYNLSNTKIDQQFSGMYKLNTITSKFKGGKFTQTLDGYRRLGQEVKEPASDASLFKVPVPKTEGGAEVYKVDLSNPVGKELPPPPGVPATKGP